MPATSPATSTAAHALRRSLLASVGAFGLWLPSEVLGTSQPLCQPDVLRAHLVTAPQPLAVPLLSAARQAAAPSTALAAKEPMHTAGHDGTNRKLSDSELLTRIARYQVRTTAQVAVNTVAASAAEPRCAPD
jgi:hypothetical protein